MHAFLSFLAVAAVAMVVPGPDTFVVLRTSLADGPRAGTWAAAGSAAGNLVWGATSVLGVAALLAASAAAFSTLKLAGAAYLAVLGVQALRAAYARRSARGQRAPRPRRSPPPSPSAAAWPATCSTSRPACSGPRSCRSSSPTGGALLPVGDGAPRWSRSCSPG